MRVALIVPQNYIMSNEKMDSIGLEAMPEYKARMRLWSCADLSLLTVAGMFPEDYELEYIDLNYEVKINDNYDIAMFSPATSQVNEAFRLADKLRANKTIIVMGGVHVSVRPEEVLEHADTIFIGEAEETFRDFLRDLKNNTVKQIYKSDNRPDLQLCSVPRYELIKQYPYKCIPVQTSRGCPHQCEFCVSSTLYGKKYRRKSLEQVRNELVKITSIWDKPYVFFTDDNMFIDEQYTYELLKILKEMKIRWYAFSDAQIAERTDLLKEISEAGCNQLLIGFESLSEENLEIINHSKWKKNKRKDYQSIIKIVQSYGIGVVGSFVLGLDEDVQTVFNNLYEFIVNSHLYATNITVLTPFPGTRIYERYKTENRIITDDWSKYNGFELTYKPMHMSIDEFDKGFKELYKKLNSDKRLNQVIDNFKHIFNERLKKS